MRKPGRSFAAAVFIFLLAACTGPVPRPDTRYLDVKIIAFNDFHGALVAPVTPPSGSDPASRSGGVAHLASAIRFLKERHPHHAVVSAGDMIGASQFASGLFLDEPTVEAFNLIGIDYNGVGNHEFDRGEQELLRLVHGGCMQYTDKKPCRVNPAFAGARFGFLGANVERNDGSSLLPGYGIKEYDAGGHKVKVGFIGLTLRATPQLVAAEGIRDLRFKDEAETANRIAQLLRKQGIAAVVILLHQGGRLASAEDDGSCRGLRGDIVPLLSRLSSEIDVVVSGHTHEAYVCLSDEREGPALLLTSAGQYGMMLTEIDLRIDTRAAQVVAKSAGNLEVLPSPVLPAPTSPRHGRQLVVGPALDVERLVRRYVDASQLLAARTIGVLGSSATRTPHPGGDSSLGNLIADAQLAATRAPERGGAELAFMNPGGIRSDLLVPAGGGPITYGDLFRAQPFGNTLTVMSLRSEQLRRLLEQQFERDRPRLLSPSANFTYRYRPAAPEGRRVIDMRLDGAPLDPDRDYRVVVNSFLASGGDGLSVLKEGRLRFSGGLDLDAMEAYLGAHTMLSPPAEARLDRVQ